MAQPPPKPVVVQAKTTSISMDDYKELYKELMRDELKITLAPRHPEDIFEEELRILVQSLKIGSSEKIIAKILSASSEELQTIELPGERLLLASANDQFIVFYTNKNHFHIFSSANLELIERGTVFPEGCMLSISDNSFAIVSMSGLIKVYSIDSEPQ